MSVLNKFKNTTIYGTFRNKDRLTSATDTTIVEQANAIIDRDLLVSGITTTSGLFIGTPSSNVPLAAYLGSIISGTTFWSLRQLFNSGFTLGVGSNIITNSGTSTQAIITDVQMSYLSTLKSNIQDQIDTVSGNMVNQTQLDKKYFFDNLKPL